jgi:DUF971 family protein
LNLPPSKIDLKKTENLAITWADGKVSVYALQYLRSMCPCAACKGVREGAQAKTGKNRQLNILPGNYADPLSVTNAELVGNYALRIDWSDQHGSGIYSFEYLREISPD